MSHSITVLKSKLHNAKVTHALKDYEGSVALSPELIKLGKFSMHEQVHLWNITQGTRLITYIMEYDGDEKGTICVNGAAAHRANPGDRVILATFAEIDSEKADNWEPHIVIMSEDNTQKEWNTRSELFLRTTLGYYYATKGSLSYVCHFTYQ